MNKRSELDARLKVHIKRAIPRLSIVQDKMRALAKVQRREIAKLVEAGKLASAKLKTELLILDDKKLELIELLDLYCTLLLARVRLLDRIQEDQRLMEAAAVVIETSFFVDLKEMSAIAEDLKVYLRPVLEDVNDHKEIKALVPEKVLNLTSSQPPEDSLITLILHEICNAYSVRLPGGSEAANEFNSSLKNPETDGLTQEQTPSENPTLGATTKESESSKSSNEAENNTLPDDLAARFAALKRK